MPPPLSPEGRRNILAILAAAVVVLGAAAYFRIQRLERHLGRASTYDRVRNVLVRRLSVDPKRVRPEASLAADLAMDPGARQELVTAIEEEFQIELPEDAAADRISTVQEAVDLVEAALRRVRPR